MIIHSLLSRATPALQLLAIFASPSAFAAGYEDSVLDRGEAAWAALVSRVGYGRCERILELSSEELSALAEYRMHGYSPINRYLRGRTVSAQVDLEKVKRWIGAIDTVISRTPTIPGGLITYRGEGLAYLGGTSHPIGKIYSDPAFISTSMNPTMADTFVHQSFFWAAQRGEGPETVRTVSMILYLPDRPSDPPTRGVLMEEFGDEREVLLGRDSIFKVMDSFDGIYTGPGFQGAEVTYQLVQICPSAETCEDEVSQAEAKRQFEELRELKKP